MARNKAIRVHLVEDSRPIKILLERELEENFPTVVAVHAGAQAAELFAGQGFHTISDFEVPGVGRVETQSRHGHGGDLDFVLVEPRNTKPHGTEVDLDHLAAVLDQEMESAEDQFLTKPLSPVDLGNILLEVTARKAARPPRDEAREAPWASIRSGPRGILGNSPALKELLSMVQRVAASSASILIQGETGTGKTLIARQIHALSPRQEKRFVAINCSAFQDQLLESELFGHEKGSFTGANQPKPGLFEVAHQGTLFLDEVGDMTPAMQAKLLQVLDDGKFRRVGGTKSRTVDARILAASNKSLQDEVEAGRFRRDLYFRLNVVTLRVPPLTERREDIPLLVEHFLERFQLPGSPRKRFSPVAMQRLQSYSWPGNVRELANTLEGLTLLAPGDEIRAEDLPPSLRPSLHTSVDALEVPLSLAEVERIHIERALLYTEGKKAPAARLLEIDVKTLRSKIKSYKIES
jgi:DNA-binding NtrC family response regulator